MDALRLGVLLLAAAIEATAAAGVRWERREPASPGRINQRILDDLDGDGRPELLLFHDRRLVVYSGRGLDADPIEPWASFEVDPTAIVFCVGDVDADPRTREVVLLRRGGIAYHAVRGGRLDPSPTPLLEDEQGFVAWGQRDDVHWRRVVADLDGDGLDDLAFPTRKGYRLLLGAPHEAERRYDPARAVEIPYPLRVEVRVGDAGLLGRTRYLEGIPDWASADFDGDGRLDFALRPAGRIEVHRGEAGGFAREAAFWLDVGALRGANGLLQPEIRDVNRDGLPDLMANEPWHGRTSIYLGRKVEGSGRVQLPPPAAVRTVNGWSWDPRLEDLDGDGYPDLILPTTERVGALEAAAVVVSGRLTVRNFVFLNTRDPERPFREEADAVREIEVDIRLSLDVSGQVRIGHTKIVSTRADFTGDGRRDLLLHTEDDALSIFPGEAKGVLGDSPWARLEIPSTADVRSATVEIADLNADGTPDLVLLYQEWEPEKDRFLLLLSRKD